MRRDIDPRGATPVRALRGRDARGTSQEFRADAKRLPLTSPCPPRSCIRKSRTRRRRSSSASRARRPARKNPTSCCPSRSPIRCRISASTVRRAEAYLVQGRRIHPDHRRRRPAVLGLPVLLRAQARQGPRAAARRDDDAQPDRPRLSGARPAREMSSTRTWSRWSRSCGTRSAATMPSRSPATPSYYEDMGYPGHVNCTDNFNGALDPYGVARAQRLDGAQLLLQHRHRRQ